MPGLPLAATPVLRRADRAHKAVTQQLEVAAAAVGMALLGQPARVQMQPLLLHHNLQLAGLRGLEARVARSALLRVDLLAQRQLAYLVWTCDASLQNLAPSCRLTSPELSEATAPRGDLRGRAMAQGLAAHPAAVGLAGVSFFSRRGRLTAAARQRQQRLAQQEVMEPLAAVGLAVVWAHA